MKCSLKINNGIKEAYGSDEASDMRYEMTWVFSQVYLQCISEVVMSQVEM